MDWDALIEVLSETIKEDVMRTEIYKRLFSIVGTDDASDSEGQDDAFDSALEKFVWDLDDEDDEILYDDDPGDKDYEDE